MYKYDINDILLLNQQFISEILILQLGTGSISSGSAKSVHSTSIATRTDSRLDDSLNESSISTLSTSYPGNNNDFIAGC